MSGIEILGVAASVIQIADLGARLSVKLFTFSRKIKAADKSIDSISQEIAATGAVLRQLGNELSKDENAELCSSEALVTTKSLVDRCMDVFNDLNSSLDGHFSSNSIVAGWKKRLKFPFLEDQIQLLRTDLERLKSSLLVMLNVLIFAAQARSHRDIGLLKDHRALVETLIEEKIASEWRYQQAQKVIRWTSSKQPCEEANERGTPNSVVDSGSKLWPSFPFGTVNAVVNTDTRPSTGMDPASVSESSTSPPPFDLGLRLQEIRNHGMAVRTLLAEVNSFNLEIGYDFRDKLHRGILGAHWKQWAPLRQVYGDKVLMDAFSEHPEVVKFWLSKLEKSALSHSRERLETSTFDPRKQRGRSSVIAGEQAQAQMRVVSVENTRANIVLRETRTRLAKDKLEEFGVQPRIMDKKDEFEDFYFDSFSKMTDNDTSNFDSGIVPGRESVPQTGESSTNRTEMEFDSDTSTGIEEHTLSIMEAVTMPEQQPSPPSTFDDHIRRYTQLSSFEYMIAS